MDVLQFLLEHIGTVLTILISLHGFALAVVNLTDTPKDDQAVAKFYKVIELLAGIFSEKKVKQKR